LFTQALQLSYGIQIEDFCDYFFDTTHSSDTHGRARVDKQIDIMDIANIGIPPGIVGTLAFIRQGRPRIRLPKGQHCDELSAMTRDAELSSGGEHADTGFVKRKNGGLGPRNVKMPGQ
jgi:hypothetical protein